jgi:hypothetical protein
MYIREENLDDFNRLWQNNKSQVFSSKLSPIEQPVSMGGNDNKSSKNARIDKNEIKTNDDSSAPLLSRLFSWFR